LKFIVMIVPDLQHVLLEIDCTKEY
jgi:hypothetical protein